MYVIVTGAGKVGVNLTRELVKRVATRYRLPYFTMTPTFSVCPTHGYVAGEHFTCPKCREEQPCEVYSRVVGYLRPVQQWNKGKKAEYAKRKEYASEPVAVECAPADAAGS